MSKASSTDVTKDLRVHTNEQSAPEKDAIGPPENSKEKENNEPSAVKLPSGISNTGDSQPSEPHEQEGTSIVAPDGDLASQAEKVVGGKDHLNLSELADTMKKVLEVLQDSTIVSKSGKDNRSRFWRLYGQVAAEHDSDFLERYSEDMGSILLFSGLFSTRHHKCPSHSTRADRTPQSHCSGLHA
jgi:hypothetical protein